MSQATWNWAGIEEILSTLDGMVQHTDDFIGQLANRNADLQDNARGDAMMGADEMHQAQTQLMTENQGIVDNLKTTLHGSSDGMQQVDSSGYGAITGV